MKRFILLIVFCLAIFQPQIITAQVKEGWREFTDKEIRFQIPAQWEHTAEPELDIIHSFSPKNKGDRLVFGVCKRLSGPKKFDVEELLDKDYIPYFAAIVRRIVESLNLTVINDHYDYTKMNGLPAVDFQYRLKGVFGQEGYFRMVFILTRKVYYGFYGIYLEDDISEGENPINEIISSIRINTEMIPDDIGPQTYGEMVQQLEITLNNALIGMPPGWGWQAKRVEVTISGDRRQIVVNLALQRPDTQTLTADYKKVMAAFKAGHEPDKNELTTEPTVIVEFSNQLFMIAGMVASGSVVHEKLPIDDIVLDIINEQGHKDLSLKLNAQRLWDLINQQDMNKLFEAINIQ